MRHVGDENGTVKSAILNIPLSLSNAVPSSQPQSFCPAGAPINDLHTVMFKPL